MDAISCISRGGVLPGRSNSVTRQRRRKPPVPNDPLILVRSRLTIAHGATFGGAVCSVADVRGMHGLSG
jgi:hypothetical protein